MRSSNHSTAGVSASAHPSWTELLKQAVTVPGTISQAYSKFHNYSLGNQLLALFQCSAREIQPGPIATFVRWKELGRYVRKGEKAITLCMPVTAKRTATTTDEQGQEEEVQVGFTRFIYRPHWFVLSQTDGADYKPEPAPGWDASAALAKLGIESVPFTMTDGNVQGYASGRTVAISPIADHPEATLFHEIAHVVLGHTAEGAMGADGRDRTPKDIRELEAECVAMLCCDALSLPGADLSRGYIQSWYRGAEVPERSAQRILHVADEILRAGRAGDATAE
jgi:antirestriction protein ArdC